MNTKKKKKPKKKSTGGKTTTGGGEGLTAWTYQFRVKPRCSLKGGKPAIPPAGTTIRDFWESFFDLAVQYDMVDAASNLKQDKNAGISQHVAAVIRPKMDTSSYDFVMGDYEDSRQTNTGWDYCGNDAARHFAVKNLQNGDITYYMGLEEVV